jgi:hypothetical protein
LELENGASLLEPILVYYRRIETFSLLLVREVLRLCQNSQKLRKYIFTLEPPTLLVGRYVDFLRMFIDKYYEDQKRSYSLYSSSSGFHKEELAKEVKSLFEELAKLASNEIEESASEH